jgi:two-component system NtrC family sensor kinase
MVPVFLRTLSVRILVGFAVLIVTFGVTAVSVVTYMDDLTAEIGIVRVDYLKLALTTKDLASRQALLWRYLKEELNGEGTAQAVQRRVASMRSDRDERLDTVEKTLDTMKNLPRGHADIVRGVIAQVDTLRTSIAGLDVDYTTLLAAPPIDRTVKTPTPPFSADALAAADHARQRLVAAEQGVTRQINDLAAGQERQVEHITSNLEVNAARLRRFTFWMGIIAAAIGLLITFSVTVTLRPLARLREAATRIARGEPGLRIDERGPVEVHDLAREFNAMARAIEERERELVRSERLAAVGKMAAMITHEVRNPLSSIALNTELLGDELDRLSEADAAEARALCRSITDEVDRLTAITEEYLAFARLPKPRLSAEPINPVVESLVTFVREDLAKRKVAIDAQLGDALPRAQLDEAQIRQSLLNLVRNAAEALGDRGGTVTLSTRAVGGRVEIEVADDGPGIAEDVRARLFDPFVTTKDGGTGLGLALTLQIVKEHGGDIRVASELGHGASFVVSLPAAAD